MVLQMKEVGKRIRTRNKIKAKDGNEYIIDFMAGRNFETVNGKIIEMGYTRIYADFYRYDEQGCWGNAEYENMIFKTGMTFNNENILKAINMIATKQYNEIEID